MPLWQFYHPPAAFATAEEKQSLVDDVTRLYTGWGLPAFYVVVQFLPVAADDSSPSSSSSSSPPPSTSSSPTVFVGGSRTRAARFVRVVIHHLAFQSQGSIAAHQRITRSIDAVLQPHVADRGWDWEYHVSESPPTMWKINGYVPPVLGGGDGDEDEDGAAVATWAREDRPSAYPGDGRGGVGE